MVYALMYRVKNSTRDDIAIAHGEAHPGYSFTEKVPPIRAEA
jgi:hypothetical protein